jgi:hypothetical protein
MLLLNQKDIIWHKLLKLASKEFFIELGNLRKHPVSAACITLTEFYIYPASCSIREAKSLHPSIAGSKEE